MRNLLILIGGLVCLMGIYLGLNLDRPATEADGPARSLAVDPGRVTDLEIRPAGGRALRIRPVDGGWRLDPPLAGPADRFGVAAVLKAVAGLSLRTVGPVTDFGPYGLDPPEMSLIVGLRDAPARRLDLGRIDPETGGRFVRLDEGDDLAVAETGQLVGWAEWPNIVRDRLVLRLDRAKLTGLALTGSGEPIELTGGPWTWRFAPDGPTADPRAVDRLLGAVMSGRVVRFVDRTPDRTPGRELRLTGPEGDKWLKLWPPDGKNDVLIGLSSRHKQPFEVAAGLESVLHITGRELTDRRLMIFDLDRADRLELSSGLRRLTAGRDKDRPWRVIESQAGPPVDWPSQRIAAALFDLSRIRYLKPAADNEFEPLVGLTVSQADGRTAALELGRPGSDGLVPARKPDSDRVYLIEPGQLVNLPPGFSLGN